MHNYPCVGSPHQQHTRNCCLCVHNHHHGMACRSYTKWDWFATIYTALEGLMVGASLWPALVNSSIHRTHLWFGSFVLVVNLLACAAMFALMGLWPSLYQRHRHRLAVANRLLRLALALLSAFDSNQVMQAAYMRPGA